MPDQEDEPRPLTGFRHRLLERLTATKTRVWMLRQRLRRGELDPDEAEAHLDKIEEQVDEASALAANLQQ